MAGTDTTAEIPCACGHSIAAHAIRVGVLGELMVGCNEPDCYCRHFHRPFRGTPWLSTT